jgi:nucleotide-binding universal stress UspA family protein
MRMLALFDGSPMSEATLGQVAKLARAPEDEVTLLSVVQPTSGVLRVRGPLRPAISLPPFAPIQPVAPQSPEPEIIEAKSQAIEREVADRLEYLGDLAGRLDKSIHTRCEVLIHSDPACAIFDYSVKNRPDLIIMTTHGRTGLVHILFGDVAEEVVRSGVAPVLLVHPDSVRHARKSTATTPAPGAR